MIQGFFSCSHKNRTAFVMLADSCVKASGIAGDMYSSCVLSRMMFFQLGSRGYQRELGPNVMSGWQPVL